MVSYVCTCQRHSLFVMPSDIWPFSPSPHLNRADRRMNDSHEHHRFDWWLDKLDWLSSPWLRTKQKENLRKKKNSRGTPLRSVNGINISSNPPILSQSLHGWKLKWRHSNEVVQTQSLKRWLYSNDTLIHSFVVSLWTETFQPHGENKANIIPFQSASNLTSQQSFCLFGLFAKFPLRFCLNFQV